MKDAEADTLTRHPGRLSGEERNEKESNLTGGFYHQCPAEGTDVHGTRWCLVLVTMRERRRGGGGTALPPLVSLRRYAVRHVRACIFQGHPQQHALFMVVVLVHCMAISVALLSKSRSPECTHTVFLNWHHTCWQNLRSEGVSGPIFAGTRSCRSLSASSTRSAFSRRHASLRLRTTIAACPRWRFDVNWPRDR